jgi:hypothetical protein
MKKIQVIKIIEIFLLALIFLTNLFAQKERVGYWDKAQKKYILNKKYFSDTSKYNYLKKYVNDALIHFNGEILRKVLEKDFKNFDILLKIARDTSIEFEDFHDEMYLEEFLILNMCNVEKNYFDFLEYYFKKYTFANIYILENFENGPYLPDTPPICLIPDTINKKNYELLLALRHVVNRYRNEIINFKLLPSYTLNEIRYYFLSDLMCKSILDILKTKPVNKWEENLKKEAIDLSNKFISVEVSSQLSSEYSKKNLLDYNLFTAWVEGNKNSGEGEWIELEFPKRITVGKVILFPGYGKSLKLFKANARLKKVKVSWNNKEKVVEFLDKFIAQSIDIYDKTDKIRIEVLEVYKGFKYKDLCVSEIMVTTK